MAPEMCKSPTKAWFLCVSVCSIIIKAIRGKGLIMINRITLWLFNIAMEHGPFIDGLPIKM